MLGHRELGLDDYLDILRRRWRLIVVPTVLGPLLGYAVSLILAEVYTSQTLVLVEQQKVPDRLVPSVVSDQQLNERLATMKEQILSRTRLQPIIERNGLYKDQINKVPMEDLVDRMRRNIVISVVQPTPGMRAGVPGFTIGFSADDPRMAQLICQQITSMFIEENLKLREARAQGTTAFLSKQLDDSKQKLDEQDAKLRVFKERYIGQLPGQEQQNLSMLMSAGSQLEAVTQMLNRALQDKAYADSLLAQQLAAWDSSQSGSSPQTLEQQLAALQNQLISLEAKYTADHPDVIKLRGEIAQLQKKLQNLAQAPVETPAGKAQRASALEPLPIQQLRAQIHQYEQTIREKTRDQARLQEQMKIYQGRVQLSPRVEQEYKQLTRDHQTALDFYNDLLGKKTASEMATDLERRQQGEQFSVMDPANLPEKPTFPNHLLFAGGGLAGGLGLGLALALLFELRDKSIRNEKDVEFYLELPALTLLPVVGVEFRSRTGFWKRRRLAQAPGPRSPGA